MPHLEWNESLSVNVEDLDEQHRTFIGIINELDSALMGDRLADLYEVRERALDRLEEYAKTHFSTEEKYMDGIAYPDLPGHRELHDAFAARISRFRVDLKEGRLVLTSDIMRELYRWFVEHVSSEDSRYAAFNKERNKEG